MATAPSSTQSVVSSPGPVLSESQQRRSLGRKRHRTSIPVLAGPPPPAPPAPPPSPYAMYLAADAPVWNSYMAKAAQADQATAKVVNDEMGSLLLFATLFSAILTAFLIDARQEIHQSPSQAAIIDLLQKIDTKGQNDMTASSPPALPHFRETSSIWVNGIWLSSLIFSLLSALLASLAQGWVSRYAYASGEDWHAAELRHRRFVQMHRWKLQLNSQLMFLPIHIALFLFGAGLVITTRNDDTRISFVILGFVVVIFVLYLGFSVFPLFRPNSPFGTPLSIFFRSRDGRPVEDWGKNLDSGPEQIIQADAIAWLLANTSRNETLLIDQSVQAIAGLPENQAIQQILFKKSVLAFLSEGLRECMDRGEDYDQKKKIYLYATIRLLSRSPSAAVASRSNSKIGSDRYNPTLWAAFSTKFEDALCLSKNTSQEIYAIGQCVRAHIFVLSDRRDETLFHTVIPILIESSEDRYIKKQLRTVLKAAKDKWSINCELRDIKISMDPVLKALKDVPIPTSRTYMSALKHLFNDDIFLRLVAKDLTLDMIKAFVEIVSNADEEVRQISLETLIKLVKDHTVNARIDNNTLIKTVCDTYESSVKNVDVPQLFLLVEGAKLPAWVITPKVLKGIVEKLNHKNLAVQQDTVEAVGNLVKLSSEFLKVFNNKNIIVMIVDKLKFLGSNVQEASVLALRELKTGENVKEIITEMLQNAPAWDVQQLAELARLDLIPAVVDKTKVINAIVNNLRNGDQSVQYHTLQAMPDFVNQSGLQVALNSKEIINAIILTLRDPDTEVRGASTQALAALVNLDILKEDFRDTLIGAILRYNRILSFPSSTAMLQVQALIEVAKRKTLSKSHRNEILKAVLNTIRPRRWRVFSRKEGKDQTIRALCELAMIDDATVHQTIKALIDKLKDEDKNVRETSVDVLNQLRKSETDNVGKIILEIVEEVQEWDVRQLSELAKLDLGSKYQTVVSKEGVIDVIIDKLEDKNVREASVQVLYELAKLDSPPKFDRHKIFNKLTKGEDWDVQQLAGLAKLYHIPLVDGEQDIIKKLTEDSMQQDTLQGVLKLLDCGSEYQAVVTKGEVIDVIVDKLKDSDENVQKASVQVLDKLAELEVDIQKTFQKLIEEEDWDVRQLVKLAELFGISVPIDKNKMKKAIVKNLQDTDLQQGTMQAIPRLMNLNPEYRLALCEKDIIIAILDKLKSQDKDVRKASLSALKELVEPDTTAIILENLDNAKELHVQQLAELAKLNIIQSVDDTKLRKAILEKLQHDDWDVRSSTLKAALELVGQRFADPVWKNQDIIDVIILQLKHPVDEVQTAGVDILAKLVKLENASQAKIIHLIVNKLEDGNWKHGAGNALMHLYALATDPDQMFGTIILKLKEDLSVQVAGFHALAKVDLSKIHASPEILHMLMGFISVDNDSRVVTSSMNMLLKLMDAGGTMTDLFCRSDLPKAVTKLLWSSDKVAVGLQALSKFNPDMVKEMRNDQELVPHLLELLQCNPLDIQGWCTGTLTLLRLGLFKVMDQVG